MGTDLKITLFVQNSRVNVEHSTSTNLQRLQKKKLFVLNIIVVKKEINNLTQMFALLNIEKIVSVIGIMVTQK